MITIPGVIPVSIHPIFWIMAFGIGWLNSNQDIVDTIMWMLVIFVSILVHEFGHAVTARAFGQQTHIELMGMGGATYRRGGNISAFKEFLIVLMGPLAGFGLFLISTFLLFAFGNAAPYAVLFMLQASIWVNFYWTILNLIPVYPMDGGKLFRIILESIFGVQGVKFSLFVSMAIAGTLSVLFLWEQQIFLAAIFLLFTYEGYKAWYSTLDISDTDTKEELQHELQLAQHQIQEGDLESAKLGLIGIRDKSQKGIIHQVATELLAEVLDHQGRSDEAYQLLTSIEGELSPEALLVLHDLTYRKGDLQKTIALGNKVFSEDPQPSTALLNAFAHARLGDARSSVGWLQCAEREGLADLKDVLKRQEFDPIRNDPHFQKVLQD
jgi:Zn-dependent protease